MTENVPPVHPAPQNPDQPPADYGQPAPQPYAPQGYVQQPYAPQGYVQQPNHQQMQYVPYPSAQQFTPAGQWVPAGPAEPRSSGYRVASSIVAIVLGVWLFILFLTGVSVGAGFAPVLFLIAAIGTLASAIVLLVKQRERLRGAPVALLGWTLYALMVSFIVAMGFGFYSGTLIAPLLAATVIIVIGIGLSREKRGPGIR